MKRIVEYIKLCPKHGNAIHFNCVECQRVSREIRRRAGMFRVCHICKTDTDLYDECGRCGKTTCFECAGKSLFYDFICKSCADEIKRLSESGGFKE